MPRVTKLALLCLLLFPIRAGAQEQYLLTIRAADFRWTAPLPTVGDSLAAVAYLREWVATSRRRAYWEASVDSLFRRDSTQWYAVLHRGPAYAWSELRAPDGPARAWLRRAGYRPRRFGNGRPLRHAAWERLRDSTLVRAATAGHPFAAVGLDSVRWVAPGRLAARVRVDPGPAVRIAELRLPEAARVRPVFLQRYLGLAPEQPYNERRIRRIPARLAQLPYLSPEAPPRITFRDSLAFVELPLRRRSASRFDFVLGVLPATSERERLLITGELNGELYNGFGQGERLAARFEQLRPQTQELEVAVDYPYLFGLPFGAEARLDLYRRDSTFLNVDYRLAATYLREGNDRLSVFLDRRTTVVPGLDSARLVEGLLPDTLGVNRSFFGLRLRRNRTDRNFSPRTGYTLDISAAAGFRRLRGVTFTGPAADSLTARSAQYEISAAAEAYFDPLAGTVIFVGLRAAALLTPRPPLVNEQYRLGGARLLRGFDEQSLFARNYALLTAEFRLLLGERAFLYAFADAARLDPRSARRPAAPVDYPLGFGAGVNFETRAGIFGLSLALGRRRGLPLDAGAPKVHLGYVSVF